MMPDKIKIGWKEYEVKKAEPNQILFTDGKECYGTISYDDNVILLRSANNENQNKATLIHEVLHGISDMYGLDLEENIVGRLADAIYTTLKCNDFKIEKV